MYPQQPSYQQGFSHGMNYAGPPPAKRPKGNTIITRYPPPPGYRGPAQPQLQPSYQTGGWTPGFQQGYPQHAYATPQPYQHPQWSSYPQQTYPSNGHPSAHGYHPLTSSFAALPHAWQQPTAGSAPPQQWQPPPTMYDQSKPRQQNSTPYPQAHVSSLGQMDGNGDLMPPQQPTAYEADDMEEDFDGEYYFARHPDEVDPNFSLGWINWHAPLPTKVPLPATFAEAELEAIAPRHPRAADEPSISEYFTKDRLHDTLLSVRQTTVWSEVSNDMIYREFPVVCKQIVLQSEMRARYRERHDPRWAVSRMDSGATPDRDDFGPEHHIKRESSADGMEINAHQTAAKRRASEDQGDVLDDLEQALFAADTADGNHDSHTAASSAHSRASSMSSTAGQRITRPVPLQPIHDHAQEDILAALGVTGSPKLVYRTPGPAVASAPPQSHPERPHSPNRDAPSSVQYGLSRAPPPPHQRLPGLNYSHAQNGHSIARPASASSQHTAAGSDFQHDDLDATPRPKANGVNGRKRSYYDTQSGGNDSHADESDDMTPKQVYKHQRVEPAF
ncbi:hypothetical protein LTR53_002399 [Teratosphaeriaceae sp. CCFEE 6253]|nr:hypothetical protein LTR53_002399 [Teratosphaeriaceae sp. CCFEE 6253]